MWLHAFRHAAASPGSEPERLSAEGPRLRSDPFGTRPAHRTVWPPFMEHRPIRRRALGLPDGPRSSPASLRSRRGREIQSKVRFAFVEPTALSRLRSLSKTALPSSAGISSCVKSGDCGISPIVLLQPLTGANPDRARRSGPIVVVVVLLPLPADIADLAGGESVVGAVAGLGKLAWQAESAGGDETLVCDSPVVSTIAPALRDRRRRLAAAHRRGDRPRMGKRGQAESRKGKAECAGAHATSVERSRETLASMAAPPCCSPT